MKSSNRNSGFTMLELLAVLAIILILGAILFPAIESAREKSLTTACSQNVKQLTLAVLTYEGDKGRFPAGRLFTSADAAGTATDTVRWYHAIRAYAGATDPASSAISTPVATPPTAATSGPLLQTIGNGDQSVNSTVNIYSGIYRCPAVPNWDPASLNMSYGYNHQYLGQADPLTVVTNAGVLATGGPAVGFVRYPVAKAAIRRSDRTICVADSDGTGWNAYQSASETSVAAFAAPATPPVGGGPDPRRVGAYAFLIDPTWLPARNFLQTPGGVSADPMATPQNFFGPVAAGLGIDNAGIITPTDGTGLGSVGQYQQQFRSIASNRHRGQCNVGFVDGHIETRAREELYFGKAVVGAGGAANVNTTFPSNELWNGIGVDNDANGNGQIDAALGERIDDENEAFTVAGGVAAVTATTIANYNPLAPPAAGYGRLTGLLGAYVDWGPGYDIVADPNNMLTQTSGPTLPHRAPFDFSFGAAAVQ